MEQNNPKAVPLQSEQPSKPVQPSKSNKYLVVLLSVLLLISVTIAIFFAYQNIKLRKQNNLQTNSPTASESGCNIPLSWFIGQIKDAGSISGTKTTNTDSWKSNSDTATENKSFNYTYMYPDNLYAVPNPRGHPNSLSFFENKEAYQKVLFCVQNGNIPLEGETLGRDWEGGCGGGLFDISVGFGEGINDLNFKKDDLLRYQGSDNNTYWIIPNGEDKFMGGQADDTFAQAEGKNTKLGWIYAELRYSGHNEAKIKTLTGLGMYQLFTHILASFKVK